MRRTTALMAALACTALLTACGGSSNSTDLNPATTQRPSPSGITPAERPAYVVAQMNVGKQPCAVEGGFGSVWVSVYGDDVVLRIDPATHKVLARIPSEFAPCGIAIGAGSVWVENYGGNSVSRIDPATNKATKIEVGPSPYDVTFAAGAAWVTNYGDDTVSRIDPPTGKVRTVKVGDSPVGIAPGNDAVWVTNQLDNSLSRIDPSTLRVTTTKVGSAPGWTSWGGHELWFAEHNQMREIDEKTGRTERVVKLEAQPNDGDVVDGTVWVPDAAGDMNAIDASSGRVLGHWPTGLQNPFVAAGWAGHVWTVDFNGTDVVDIDPQALPH